MTQPASSVSSLEPHSPASLSGLRWAADHLQTFAGSSPSDVLLGWSAASEPQCLPREPVLSPSLCSWCLCRRSASSESRPHPLAPAFWAHSHSEAVAPSCWQFCAPTAPEGELHPRGLSACVWWPGQHLGHDGLMFTQWVWARENGPGLGFCIQIEVLPWQVLSHLWPSKRHR